VLDDVAGRGSPERYAYLYFGRRDGAAEMAEFAIFEAGRGTGGRPIGGPGLIAYQKSPA
jgi:hypothetical protein